MLSKVVFFLKALLPWTLEHGFLDIKMIKAVKEVLRWTYWKTAKVLEDHGLLDKIVEDYVKGPAYCYHKYNAEALDIVLDTLKEGGYISYTPVKLLKRPEKEPPPITVDYVREVIPVFDEVMETLPDWLLRGEKKFLWLTKDSKALFLKFLECSGYRKVRAYVVRWSSLSEFDEDKTIVDVGAGMGLSTVALLQHTKSNVIAVDPDPTSIQFAESYVKFLGLDVNRVKFICCRGEDMVKHIDQEVDGFLMINVMHWMDAPMTTLMNVRSLAKRDSKIVITQVLADYHKAGVWIYLMGAHKPPTKKDFLTLIKSAKFRVVKRTMFPMPTFVLKPVI